MVAYAHSIAHAYDVAMVRSCCGAFVRDRGYCSEVVGWLYGTCLWRRLREMCSSLRW